MASKKKIFRIGNNLDPFCQVKLKDLPREVTIKNMSFDEWGNLCKRAGYAKYNTTPVAATTVDADSAAAQAVLNVAVTTSFVAGESVVINEGGVREEIKTITSVQAGISLTMTANLTYKQTESSKYTLAVCGTVLYFLDAEGIATFLKGSLTSEAETFFIDFVNRCLIANGNQNLMKTDGENVYTVGITVPTIPTVSVVADTGKLSVGNYYFRVTYVDEDGNESNASVASLVATITAVGQKVTVTPSFSTITNIAKRNIYRTLAGGASYYYDGQIENNTEDATFSSVQSDDALVQANSLENYHEENHDAPPSTPSLMAKRGGRIYLAVNQKLHYSKRFYEYFPANFWIAVGNMRNITGIINQLHTLQVSTKNSVERLLGTSAQIESADYFQFKDSYSSKGVYATRSLVDCDNYIVFLHKDGLYIVNIDQVKELNVVLNKYLKTNINQAHIDKSCACFYDGKYILSYPTNSTHPLGASTVPNETVYFDFKDGTYGIYDFAFNCYSVWGQAGEDSLKAGSTVEGRVYDVFSGLADDDTLDIEAYDTLPYLYFGSPDTYKQFYTFYIKIKSTFTTGTSTLNFYYQLDGENGIETEKCIDVILTANTTKWYKIDLVGGGQRGRGIKLKPRMSDQYYWEIQGIHIVYREEEPLWGKE